MLDKILRSTTLEKILNDEIAKQVKDMFSDLVEPVEVLFFSKEEGCGYCNETRQLIFEVTTLSDKLSYVEYDIDKDSEIADQYNVGNAPTLALTAKNGEELIDYGLRFVGAPAGHEFTTLIHGLISVSKREADLNEETREFLNSLKDPLLLQVFVTPT